MHLLVNVSQSTTDFVLAASGLQIVSPAHQPVQVIRYKDRSQL